MRKEIRSAIISEAGRELRRKRHKGVRFLAVLLVWSLLGASISSGSVNGILENDELSKIVETQSVLVSFFYHTSLPIKMVNACIAQVEMSEGIRLPSPAKKQVPVKRSPATADGAIAAVDGSAASFRNAVAERVLGGTAGESEGSIALPGRQTGGKDLLVLFPLFLLFRIYLPGNSGEAESVKISLWRSCLQPDSGRSEWGFFIDLSLVERKA